MADRKNKSLMRSLGEFVGHIVKAAKTDPGKKRTVLEKTTQEEARGNLTLRRTTIDEIEIHDANSPNR
jgi:hypothetical protein